MTGIVKTDQLQGAQGTTITVPTGHTLAVTSNATVGGTAAITGNTTVGGTLGVTGTLTTAAITSTGRHEVNFNGGSTQAFKYTDTAGGNLASFGQFYNTSDGLIGNIQNANNDGIHLMVKNGSICFTQTGYNAANALDDYEEGTWTPTISGGFTSVNIDYQRSNYIKVGKNCTVYCSMRFAGTSAGANFILSGLPFATETAANGFGNGTGAIGYATLTTYLNQNVSGVYLGQNNTKVYFYATSGAAASSNANASNDWVEFSATYPAQ